MSIRIYLILTIPDLVCEWAPHVIGTQFDRLDENDGVVHQDTAHSLNGRDGVVAAVLDCSLFGFAGG